MDDDVLLVTVVVVQRQTVLQTSGKDLNAGLGDEKSVLVLCGAGSIRGDGGPVIRPGLVLGFAQVEHGFDGEDVTGLHASDGFVLGVMGYVGGGVEELADAVAAVGSDDGEFVLLGLGFDVLSEITIPDLRKRFNGGEAY